jgi:hypothetical protein
VVRSHVANILDMAIIANIAAIASHLYPSGTISDFLNHRAQIANSNDPLFH